MATECTLFGPEECEAGCGRCVGEKLDRDWTDDGIPVGPLAKCEVCGLWACPDCLHEGDCCEAKRHLAEIKEDTR